VLRTNVRTQSLANSIVLLQQRCNVAPKIHNMKDNPPMLSEIYPDGSPEFVPKRPVTPKQIAANQRNALLSTGPNTDAGKAKSRQNALKHGLCAMVLDVPGEDPAVFDQRLNDWNSELNPHGSSLDAYLVTLMTRHSINLDRCFSIQTAKVAQLSRDAIKDHDEEVAREVEDLLVHLTQTQQYKECNKRGLLKADYLKIGPPPQPGHAVRRLLSTARGCQALFDEWDLLKAAMAEPPTWDNDDAIRAANLMGASASTRGETCNPMGVATADIIKHRDVAFKLKNNLKPGRPWGECYINEADHQLDRDEIEELTYNAASGSAQINTLIDGQQRMICMMLGQRTAEEELSRAEAPYRAKFDASNDGKLLYRYQAEQHRGFIKIAELLKKQARDADKAVRSQPVTATPPETVATSQPVNSTPPVSRNEAIEASTEDTSRGSNRVESERITPLPVTKKSQKSIRRRR
jgi:hypothetical protein